MEGSNNNNNNNNKKNNEDDTNKTKKKNKEEKNGDVIPTTITTMDDLAFTKTKISRTRVESDSIGTIEVPAEHYWGAQTQHSLVNFSIGDDRMPKAVYHAYGYVKKATGYS